MPSQYGQDSISKATYIPPQIKQAMDKQAAQSLPAHLRQYVGSDRPAYVPKGVEAKLTQHLQKSMPAHLGQYAGAYVQQNLAQANVDRPTTITPHAPVPDRLRLDHSASAGSEQHTVALNELPTAANSRFSTPDGNAQIPASIGGPVPGQGQGAPDYGFILEPDVKPRSAWSLPSFPGLGSFSLVVYGLVALIALVILFNVISGLLKGPSAEPQLMAVAADQQELAHIATDSGQFPDISGSYLDYAATLKLVAASNQAQLFNYMTLNKLKIDNKLLMSKVSAATDNELKSAEAAGTFNQAFGQVNESLLNSYKSDLGLAFKAIKGPKGQALLRSDYAQASKLQVLLNSNYQ